jgi:hypothetical protein
MVVRLTAYAKASVLISMAHQNIAAIGKASSVNHQILSLQTKMRNMSGTE